MSLVYAESSAVLRWLLGSSDAPRIHAVLVAATRIHASALTRAEVLRTLCRSAAAGEITPEQQAALTRRFLTAASRFATMAVTDEVLQRLAQPFPVEPVRTLDGVHLATAMRLAADLGPLTMLSTDHRVRDNARALGLPVAP